MIPLAVFLQPLGKRITKVTYQAMDKAGIVNTYLIEIFKNHKLIKIFQKKHMKPQEQTMRLKNK